jgi:hypothetical protein
MPSFNAIYQKFRSSFEKATYSTQIILLISSFGALRIVIAIIIDLIGPIRPLELMVDITLLIIFLSVCILLVKKPLIQYLPLIVGVFFAILINLNFANFKGVEGSSKFNFYGGLYLLIMMYEGWRLRFILVFYFLLATFIICANYFSPELLSSLILTDEVQPYDFIFIALAISLFTFYLRGITENANRQLEGLGKTLNEKVREAKKQNADLIKQSAELKAAQNNLENEVSYRTLQLQNKNERIENYIHLNTVKLVEEIGYIRNALTSIQADTQLKQLLKISVSELLDVSAKINDTIKKENRLLREKLESSHGESN